MILHRTIESTSGRIVPPPPLPVPSMPGSVDVEGREIERRGVSFDLDAAGCEGRDGDESTGPAIEAYMCDS